MDMIHAPWPLFQYASGDVEKLYFWPIWGKKSRSGMESRFFLWPIVSTHTMERPGTVLRRHFVLPFVLHESVHGRARGGDGRSSAEPADGAPALSRYFKAWPLMSYRREGTLARIRMLDLWPTKDLTGVEKNYAAFWTLYSRVRTRDAEEQEALWGLFRYRRDADGRRKLSVFPFFSWVREPGGDSGRWSVLLGLGECRREGHRRRYRVLYRWMFGDE
jgi:hypothetical protein